MPGSRETLHRRGRFCTHDFLSRQVLIKGALCHFTLWFLIVWAIETKSPLSKDLLRYYKWRRRDLLFLSISLNVQFDKQFSATLLREAFSARCDGRLNIYSLLCYQNLFKVWCQHCVRVWQIAFNEHNSFNLLTNLLSKHVCFTIIKALKP